MSESVFHQRDGGTARVLIALVTAAAALLPLVDWKWLSSVGVVIVGAVGFWFNLSAHRRAVAAEARAVAAERRAAEAHAWSREEREHEARRREERRPVQEWVDSMREEHGSGVWFPIEEPHWEMAHAAARLGLAEVDDSLAPYKIGRARVL